MFSRIPQIHRKPQDPHTRAVNQALGHVIAGERSRSTATNHHVVEMRAIAVSKVQHAEADAFRTVPSLPFPSIAHAR